MAEQTNAFRLFNTDLSLKLKQSFSESVGPTLERMMTAVEDLNVFLRQAEANRQDSIFSQVEGLLKRVEQSMVTTLESIGTTFTQSLSGSAKDQFDKVVSALSGASGLLESMNSQFINTQAALGDLIKLAKNSTAEQIAMGHSQVESLTNVLKDLMVQLKDTTGSSVTEMSTALSAIMLSISEKLNKMSDDMTTNLTNATKNTAEAAQSVIKRADDWSSQSATQLDKLIEKYQSQIELTSDLNGALKSGLTGFKDSLTKYGQVTNDLKGITSEMSLAVGMMNQVSVQIKETQDALKAVATITAEQIQNLRNANDTQKATWDEIYKSMQQYQKTFTQVEGSAKALLMQISDNLKDYTETIEENFKGLVTVSNEHFSNAYQRLKQSVEDLDELLQDLHEILIKRK